MAARKTRITLNDSWKDKIKLSQIINRIQDCAMGDIEMSPVQMKAAEVLLRKMVPDLKAVELNASVNGDISITSITRKIVDGNSNPNG